MFAFNVPYVLNCDPGKLSHLHGRYVGRVINRIDFSLRLSGGANTLKGLSQRVTESLDSCGRTKTSPRHEKPRPFS